MFRGITRKECRLNDKPGVSGGGAAGNGGDGYGTLMDRLRVFRPNPVAFPCLRTERVVETAGRLAQRDLLMGINRPGHAWLDGGEIERNELAEYRLRRIRCAPQVLRLHVRSD